MSDSTLCEFFLGAPGMGKTTLAQHRAIERAGERGVPVVLLDPEGALHPEGAIPFRNTPPGEELIHEIWDEGHHVVYTPGQCEENAELFFGMVRRGGNVCLLVDECAWYARGAGASPALLHLGRTRRLAGVDLYFTSQYPADLHPVLWALRTRPSPFIFRCEGATALSRFEHELGLDDEQLRQIRTLEPRQFLSFPEAA